MTTIAQMTREELQQLIDERIDERLTSLLGRFEVNEEEMLTDDEADTRTWEEVKRVRHAMFVTCSAKNPTST